MAFGFNFNERARQVIAAADATATRQHLAAVGTEQLLAALLHEPDAETTAIFAQLDVDVNDLLASLKEIVNPDHEAIATEFVPPYTTRAKKVLEFAMAEARAIDLAYVGTEHLLLGLIREGGIVAQPLAEVGVTLDATRAATVVVLAMKEEMDSLGRIVRPISRVEVKVHFADGTSVREDLSSRSSALQFLTMLA